MRVVAQRCTAARVVVDGEVTGEIGRGLVAFVGCGRGDDDATVAAMLDKVLGLRVFADDAGKMARCLTDLGLGLLVVSQFTLYGDVRRGRRPSFDAALPPDAARRLLARFADGARARGVEVGEGRFGADMRVLVENDGPVTVLIDSQRAF
ncbi:MAG: D-tyrosyl-tRNA(Tyr) deacylase [Polyangiaceae bacterium]|nr:D-tyrosyl-tRNA(Tyr) deacylase [Polyangiaceae bacterium]